MPATEKTWRDQARMHVIFGVSALVMLAGTIWMLAKDHNREWRDWQVADRSKERWMTEAQLAQAEANSSAELKRLRSKLLEATSTKVDATMVERFKELVKAEDDRLKTEGHAEASANFSRLNSALKRLNSAKAGKNAQEARRKLVDELNRFVHEAKRRENTWLTQKKLVAADQTAAVSSRGIAIGEGRPTAEIERRIQKYADDIIVLDAKLADAKDYRLALEAVVKEIQAKELELENQIAAIETDINRMRENLPSRLKTTGEWVNRAPVLDALYTGDIKLDQIWLPDMTINYNFSSVARYDRCIVCHRAIDKTAPRSTDPAYPAIPRGKRERTVQLATPPKEELALERLYGLTLEAAPQEQGGEVVKVADVQPDSTADIAGVKKGDVIRQVGVTPVTSLADVERILLEPDTWDGYMRLTVQPSGSEKIVETKFATPDLTSLYGIVLAPEGQIAPEDVTIQVVGPQTLAAMAGLEMGDVIVAINGGEIDSDEDVTHYLIQLVNWGEPVEMTIRRGLDQPFTSHPRLDLFVGSTSPHKKGEMGCTICHDGQGSATDFRWASHTPNDPHQALEWSRDPQLRWFENHHWIFPMTPERFIESNCLKCHHDVVELEPSERFPEPPAPKLVKGYDLVRQYGCFGCHEIPGYDGPTKRTGPDLRVEPNFSEVASQILADQGLNDHERQLARSLAEQPHVNEIRDELMRAISADAALAKATPSADPEQPPKQPRLTAATHALADALKDVEAPGRLRKAGPSLRYLASKVDYDWLYSWIRRPSDFRPSTRMPQFFLQHEHLDDAHKNFSIRDAAGKEQKVTDREYTERFENIEIRALAQFLLSNSQPFEYLPQPDNVTEAPSAERGKWQFESRGCLACHSHSEFPGIASTQGPDLSRIAAKFNSEKGQRWLYSWVKAPNRYHARTVMPNVFLDPIVETDASGNPTGRVTDPAADVMAFLLSVPTDWRPEVDVAGPDLSADEKLALNDLTAVWLSASFPRRRAERFAKEGIDERLAATVKVDEQVLLGKFENDEDRANRQLEYVARRSLSRYGCFGCHDIPGYETAKPIGTPLASWGRKDPSQLAFENIGQFLATHGIDGTEGSHHADQDGADDRETAGIGSPQEATVEAAKEAHGDSHAHGLDPLDSKYDSDTAYFLQSLNSHQRHGFLWQKLRMPRSFDYETTRTKRYDERLRMPKFPFNAEEREAVMTFVLGLTNEAPASRYIYKPSPRQSAIVEGRHVLEKYNCAGCHVLDVERWNVAFEPDWFEEPTQPTDYPFVIPVVTPEEIDDSLKPDRRGLLHAELHGMPVHDEVTGAPRLVDEDGVPIEPDDSESKPYYEFQLFEHAVVGGAPRLVGTPDAILLVAADLERTGPDRGKAYPTTGGDLAKYLFSRVIAEEKKTNPSAIATEAWGWLPPPLHHEGAKVQTDWLHDFLMDPTPIRPAVVLRMPNFHMSSEEAAKLVNYFAAKNNVEFPYEYNERRRGGYLADLEGTHPTLFDDAMKIVTDGNYCVKCHSVGDYEVRGSVRTLGPKLDEVYRRLRPDYTRRWIANPQRILPYTGMPVNIPYDPAAPNLGGVNQALFPGTSIMQVDGVVDLLMNFDEYTKRRTSVKSLVREPTQSAEGEPSAATEPPDDRSASRATVTQ
jgi:S1-C subfamily serine protease